VNEMAKTIEKQKMSTAQHLEQVLKSSEFQEFCSPQCPFSANGCRCYCVIFTFESKLGGKQTVHRQQTIKKDELNNADKQKRELLHATFCELSEQTRLIREES
jgi:hypothetical protein